MKHISILIPNGQYSIVNIGGAFQILNWANDAFTQQTRKQLFQVELVSFNTPANDADGFYTVYPTRKAGEIDKTDLVIIPAVHGDIDEVLEKNKETINWVLAAHAGGAEVAALCVGSYLLAQSGLLNGRTCSTHWGSAEDLQQKYPEVTVEAERIVTDSNGIYTCGGAYAFTNLLIYLIEKYGGRDLAIMTSKAFMIEIDKNSQSPFMIFNGQKGHDDEVVLKVQESIENNYNQPLTVGQLADDNAVGRRTLERRFREATGNSILEYLQRVRMESAKKHLEKKAGNVSEAMYESGYSDPKAFRDVFRKYVGMNPTEYKNRFQVQAV